jgi:hypothetical protein
LLLSELAVQLMMRTMVQHFSAVVVAAWPISYQTMTATLLLRQSVAAAPSAWQASSIREPFCRLCC